MIESEDYNIKKNTLAVIVNALIFSFETKSRNKIFLTFFPKISSTFLVIFVSFISEKLKLIYGVCQIRIGDRDCSGELGSSQ